MEAIVFLPFFIVLVALVINPPEKVFQNYYLLILMMLPQIFVFHINRIPDISFAQAAIIPLFFLGFFTRLHRWNWSTTDFIITIYLLEMIYSEYTNEGLGSTAQLITNEMTNMIFPYALAKILIHPAGYTVSFAKRITILVYINILLSVYEERFMVNPYLEFFQHIFPSQGFEWPTIERYGLTRIAGPFVQPILFAISCSIAFFLNYWLQRNGYWGKHYKYMPDLPIPKGWLFGIVIFIGLIMTFSRGPVLALFLGFIFVGVAKSKHPWPSFLTRLTVFTVICLCISQVYDYYSSIGVATAASDQAMTLAYRTELIQKYAEITWERPWFGWGASSWPKVANTVSIDNQYLWQTLKHGFLSVWIFGALVVNIVLRLMKRGLSLPLIYTRERSLDFTFLSLYLALIFSFATVYMGMQIEPLFFILTGWIEGYDHTKPQHDEEWDKMVATPQHYVRRH